MQRPDLTPCLICEKAVIYLWNKTYENSRQPTNLNSASEIKIESSYGSNFDANDYSAIICDECLDKAIQSKRVTYIPNL